MRGQLLAQPVPNGGQVSAALAEPKPRDPKMMEQKIARAQRLLRSCRFCERDCRVDRLAGEVGACGCDADSHLFFEGLLYSEESFIVPTYALFFAGCGLRCAFCSVGESNRRPAAGEAVAMGEVAQRVASCDTRPASFSFIGGEPSVHLHTALRLIAALPADLPVVWSSNLYFSKAAACLLESAVDVFIAGLHFGNDDCALRVGEAPRYLEVLKRNLLWAAGAGELVVRHLLLPGHYRCCTEPALTWLAGALPQAPVHLLTSYVPPEPVRLPGLRREVSETEVARALELAQSLGLRLVE